MIDFNLLKDSLIPDILIPSKEYAILKEDNIESKIKMIQIENLPKETLIFTLDYQPNNKEKKYLFQQLSLYFNKQNKIINKKCDYILITHFKSKNYIILIELKSDDPDLSDCKIQLFNSEQFIYFWLNLLNIDYSNFTVIQQVISTTLLKGKPKTSYHDKRNDKVKVAGYPFYNIKLRRNIEKPIIKLEELLNI